MCPKADNTSTADALGLSKAEATRRLATHGPNTIPEPARPRPFSRVLAQLRDPMILLLLAAAALTVSLGDWADTVVILLVVTLNTTVGVVQEVRAEAAIQALRRLGAPSARVLRDGVDVILPARELVPDDVIKLEAGDIVPADADLVEAVQLQCDESSLTGESVPVDKSAGPDGQVLAGTVVTRGRGVATVRRTGKASSLGRIASLVADAPPGPTPLQRRLAGLGRMLALAAVALSGLVLVSGLLRGEELAPMVVTAVSLAVAAVPESLPAVVTVALALGARRMARRSALVRRLPAVETLGSVSVLATDKTGTLTENRMVVQRLFAGQRRYDVTGTGYRLSGAVAPHDPGNGQGYAGAEDFALERLLRDGVLCNDAQLAPPVDGDDEWTPIGDPTEVALLVLAAKAGMDATATRARFPRVREVPFDSARARMTTVHSGSGDDLVVSKGAPEVVLEPGVLAEPDALIEAARHRATELAADGFRVLAVADAPIRDGRPGGDEQGLELAGLVAIADPPRADVPDVVRTFRDAGVHVLLITGDHPATATAIARRVGIADERSTVLTGDQLGGRPPTGQLDDIEVFARTRPEQKLDIVRAWQQHGHVVAMTGDGVNDAPALRAADIGVAMGRGGTEVARQAADLVLTDDALGTVTAAIEEGRRIYTNIRRFLCYALSGGAAEVLIMLTGPVLGFAVPLLPAQILWINMLTHGLPGVAMGAEPADPEAMREPPRPPAQSILAGGLARRIAVGAALITAAALVGAGLVRSAGGPWQTALFVVLGLAQLGVALALVHGPGHRWRDSRFLLYAVAGAVALQLAGVWLPPMQALLGTESLTVGQLAWCLALAALPGLAFASTTRGTKVLHRTGLSGSRRGPSDPAQKPRIG
ncbi:MAG: cation-translocating P-type ATPase [Actinomycetes bacterium]